MKSIWIFSHYAGGPSYCPALRDYSLARYLMKQGYDVKIFASSAVHNTDTNIINDKSKFVEKTVDGVPFVYIRTRSYQGSGLNRVLNMTDYYFNLFCAIKGFAHPDLVIAAMPQPLACVAGAQVAKKYHIPFICSIVDLWPESIVEYANVSRHNPLILALYILEKWLYIKADELVFTWEGAYDYIIDRGWNTVVSRDKFHYINIGVDVSDFEESVRNYPVEDIDLDNPSTFKVMYCGSIRIANDIGTVVSCAKELSNRGYGETIKFIIYGDGPDCVALKKRCEDEEISNIVFKGFIKKQYIPSAVSKSDLNILNLKQASTQKYGNSSNKLFEYFAAGNPVIANIDEGEYPIISKYGCGIVLKDKSVKAYADAVEMFYNLPNEAFDQYLVNAKKAVRDFDTAELNAKFETVIKAAIKEKETVKC